MWLIMTDVTPISNPKLDTDKLQHAGRSPKTAVELSFDRRTA